MTRLVNLKSSVINSRPDVSTPVIPNVTLDSLVKDGEYQNIYQDALNSLKQIEKLPQEERSHLFVTMDTFFAKNKLQNLLK